MSAIEYLLTTNPFDFCEENKKLFRESIRECAQIHYDNNTHFRYFWDLAQIRPSEIKTEADLMRIPPILVTLFKEYEWLSCSREQIALTLGSSGTTGQRSLMHLDQGSLGRVKKLAYEIHKYLGMTSDKAYHYLCFTYDPAIANDLGTAFTDELLTNFTAKKDVYYALEYDESIKDFKLNKQKVAQKLIDYAKGDIPVRILGFPAFLYQIVKEYKLSIKLPPDSWIQTGGGWKNHSDETISKSEFRKLMQSSLGIPESNTRDMFGMVEHGIPYVDFEDGEFRIPNYARVFIRDPYTMKVVPDGEIGLAQFVCSYNTSYPTLSILTTDWARVLPATINHPAQRLEILGRAGVKKHKGCAITALEKVGNA